MTVRGVRVSGGGGNSVGGGGFVGQQSRVLLSDLPLEEQHAHEIVSSLKDDNEFELRVKIVEAAGASEPVGAGALKLIAELYENLGMPLSATGVQRFKQDRALVGGTSLSGFVAKAYAWALDGNEILVRITKKEELELRPSELACARFLRELGKKHGAADLGAVKKALSLGNPPLPPAGQELGNEYVGVVTVKEIAKATTMRNIPLTKDGMKQLVAQLRAESDKEGNG